jgi:hypothetical protein
MQDGATGVTVPGAIAVCGESSDSISDIATSYATGAVLRVRWRLGCGRAGVSDTSGSSS